jgi:hypothetical protein
MAPEAGVSIVNMAQESTMNKATAQQTMSKAGEFVWDVYNNQCFTGPGQTVKDPPQRFDKIAGNFFSMDAPGQTLTLEIDDNETLTTWSQGDLNFPPPTPSTEIGVKNGHFVFKSNAFLEFGFPAENTITRLAVENEARFTIEGSLEVLAHANLAIDVKNKGRLDMNCRLIDFSQPSVDVWHPGDRGPPRIKITVQDTAQVSMTSSSSFSMSNATVTVFSSTQPGPDEYALRLLSGSADPLTLIRSALTFSGRPKGLLRCPMLVMDDTFIKAAGDSLCFLQFNGLSPTDGAHFALGGRAQMKFDSFSGGSEAGPFQFISGGQYSKGLFAFENAASTVDTGGFVIRVTYFPEAKNAILTQQLVSVDGEPQGNESLINITQSGDYLIVRVK